MLLNKILLKIIPKMYLNWCAIISGVILVFAFAPFGYFWLAEIALMLLLFVWLIATPKQAFRYGWLFGVAFFSGSVYWVYVSLHNYGHAPHLLALVILGLLIVTMALYPALQGYLFNRFYPENNWPKLLLVFPASFAIFEWVRGWFLSGFPWGFLGYSHVDSLLSGYATVFGVYGVSFFVAQTAAAIFGIFYWWRNKRMVIGLVLLIVVVWGGGFGLTKINWTRQIDQPIKVSLLQGNVDQDLKWQPEQLWPTLGLYSDLTVRNYSSKIVVWPEAAIPAFSTEIPIYLKTLSFAARSVGVTILSGILFHDEQDQNYYNGIIALGAGEGKYYKRQLVPFGEYLPFKSVLKWLHKFLAIPMSDFSSGSRQQSNLIVENIAIAPFVCYEIAYPGLVLDYLPKAGVMVTVSDDSWFGDSSAPYQHLEISRLRSIEVGRYQLLSTNTGISAIIDNKGKIITKTQMFKREVISADILNLAGSTPWVKLGQYLWLPLMLLCLILGYRKKR